MIAGVHGRLITTSFAETELGRLCDDESPPAGVVRDIERWATRCESMFGPASSIRAIADGIVLPLAGILGFDLVRRVDAGIQVRLDIGRNGVALAPAVVIGWDHALDGAWRTTVLDAIGGDARWAFCCNGTSLRILDAHRTWSRNALDFDLAVLAHDAAALTLLWRVARAESLARQPPLLDVAVDLSARYGIRVCGALGNGVIEALELLVGSSGRVSPDVMLDQSLTVLYRVLFLLFAEARALVPVWHPIYRDRYTIDSIVSTLLSGRRYRGVWAAVTAISRLAHAGCSAGELKVTAFNGRLFAPTRTDAIEHAPIPDSVMGNAVLAVSTTPPERGKPRRRIVYQDLDVEELGAVYEHVLEYEPAALGGRSALARSRDLRKATGTFYTPRSITAHLVRATLAPLIADRSSDEILQLRVLDPAMGSGAFLVAACIQLAEAAEEALVREGRWQPGDVTAIDRLALRRLVAQRCVFGVDMNPTAVQVARLSLWLTTLAADKPLTFLDHRLVAGNSLVGATPDDVLRQPAGRARHQRSRRPASVPLFDSTDLEPVLRHAAQARLEIASQPDDSAAIVRGKEKALAALHSPDAALGRHARLLDVWCASWFWRDESVPDRGTFAALADVLLDRPAVLPHRLTTPLLASAARVSSEQRFLHWPLAFPEVFHDANGHRRADAGFDAVVGNPPWDMVRGDSGDSDKRSARRDEAKHLVAFVRESGIYRVEPRSHVNRYQLFVERAMQLTRCGGRIGLVLPAGTMSDGGCAPLRRFLFDRARVDSVTYLDNRRGIFPIHRSLTFLLLTCTPGERTDSVACRFGLSDPEQLDQPASPVVMTRALLARLSGDDDLAIPELQDERDVRLLERISARFPTLSAPDGWHVAFGRELNATDDRDLFIEADRIDRGRPVLEGKAIEPFRASTGGCRFRLREDVHVSIPRRPRLAYRDVASATNRLTLIAAIIPPAAVTTHTLFCLKTALSNDAQHVLCALLNSFVANYLVRPRVNTHVTVTLVSRLRVPRLDPASRTYRRLSSLAETLMHSPSSAESQPEYAELQALVARAYELSEDDFRHVLTTFPLIPNEITVRCLIEFRSLVTT